MEKTSGRINKKFSFSKKERLCSKKLFDKLFSEGSSLLAYPLQVLYYVTDHPGDHPAQAAFAASKKVYRKSVSRSLLKRRMREAYRLNKHILYERTEDKKLIIVFIYIGKTILKFHQIEKSVKRALSLISDSIS
jgi:ribonuclease P protein component